MLVSGIFMDAWQISAITEQKARDRFYTKVVDIYSMLLFVIASGAILMTRVIPLVLFDKSYYDAWRYIPLPVVSIVFTCLVNFLGSIYMVEKRSIRSLLTAMLSAVINIALNLWWIPLYGVNGAAARRSFVTSWFRRPPVDTRKFVRIKWVFPPHLNAAVLMTQCYCVLREVPYWILYELALFALMLLVNGRGLIVGVRRLFRKKPAG